MASPEFRELANLLLRLGLATDAQLQEYTGPAGAGELLDFLERKGSLSGYQISQLRKQDYSSLVLGHYALVYRNASGSFARVYRARSLRDGTMVGLKVLRSRWAKDPKAVVQFRREAELGKTLQHENIVPIYEVGQDGDQHYLTMEFVEGGNLREFIDIRKKLSPLEATKCVLDMSLGLEHALSKGLTHRDLKMTNVLMGSRGVAKLVDFGLAGQDAGKAEELAGESAQRALEYATLEKGSGAPRNDPRSDLFFLGAIYYELLSGVPPFARTRDRAERSQFSRYSIVKPLRQLAPELPLLVTNIVDRLLKTSPHQRHQSPTEVVAELRPAYTAIGGQAEAVADKRPVSAGAAPASTAETVLCVETRLKQQDMLRQYFTKHGYRVLMLTDLKRALNRVRESPPAGIIIMGESLEIETLDGFQGLQRPPGAPVVPCLLVLSDKQAAIAKKLAGNPTVTVMQQPVALRGLRKALAGADAAKDDSPE